MIKEHKTIIRPIVSEKSTLARERENQYYFEVTKAATKPEIKKAVEKLFNVKVESVNISLQFGKMKRVRYRAGLTSDKKKAFVKLKKGETIKLFEGK